ncbi:MULTISPECIES: hypothetical protein [Bacillus]|uniref:hypothetical protein n=1 Tax=Bacillus TaxID=1386 RepID=UPI001EE525B8|nr:MULTISPECIES: hypothetical protein [Bacillus]
MLYIHFIYREGNFFYSHHLKYILVIEIKFPIIGIILEAIGKPGKQKIIAITLNSLIFILFPL